MAELIPIRVTELELNVLHRACMHRLMYLQRETDETDTYDAATERYVLRQMLDKIALRGNR